MSSDEWKTSKFSLMLRTRENSDVFNKLDEICLVLTSKTYISSIYSTTNSGTYFFTFIASMTAPDIKDTPASPPITPPTIAPTKI